MASASQIFPLFEEDPFSEAALADSVPVFRRLRELGPVAYLPELGIYAISHYDAVAAGLRLDSTLVSGQGVSFNVNLNGEAAPRFATPITSDGETHRRLKKLEMRPLMPVALAGLRERIEHLATQTVRKLATGQTFEAMAGLASVIPTSIVVELVGLKGVGAQRMLAWSEAIFNANGPATVPRTNEGVPVLMDLASYSATLTREGVEPGSWADRILDAADSGEITAPEAQGLIIDYVVPSLDTTILATGELLFQLASLPGSLDLVREKPAMIPGIIDEAVRLASPIRGFTRFVASDYEVGGGVIPAGSRVVLLFASANRDERHYPEPDRFLPERGPRDHLGWGLGVHSCTGRHLARLEMETLLACLAQEIETIEFDEPARLINNSLQGFRSLPMRLRARKN
jgi:cytochrome P450